MAGMTAPLASSFLVPDAAFLIAVVVLLAVTAVLVSGLVWLLVGRRG